MISFFVVLAFIAWILFAGAATVITRMLPPLSRCYPYVWRIALWTSVGVVAANGALVLATWMAARALSAGPQQPSNDAGQWVWVLALVAGPPLASAAGWTVGAITGVVLAVRRQARLAGGLSR